MKKYSLLIPIIFLATLIFTASCEKSYLIKGELTERVTYLYLNYWNPDIDGDGTYGDAPQIELDSVYSSKAIKIDFTKDFKGSIDGTDARIIIDNMRIVDEYGNFKIESIAVEEFQDGVWQTQSAYERPVLYTGIEDLNIVLVLDASSSMKDEYTNLKASAINFIDDVLREIPSAKFGIVSFGDIITPIDITNDIAAVKAFVNQMEPIGQDTYLYSGMLEGISLLKATQAESKVLVTFTDGGDNEGIHTPTEIIDALNNDVDGITKIQSYAIGLVGDAGVQTEILDQMCVRGFGVYPENGEELEEFFDYFSKVVSSVYNLTYERNLIKIAETDKRQIRFKLTTQQK